MKSENPYEKLNKLQTKSTLIKPLFIHDIISMSNFY